MRYRLKKKYLDFIKEDISGMEPEGLPSKEEGSTDNKIDTDAIDDSKKPFIFDSKIRIGEKLSQYPVEVIKNEVMLFNCDWEYAYEVGGEPTKEFLLSLPKELQNKNTIIDSRVHMFIW
jgi:hypothetical protein